VPDKGIETAETGKGVLTLMEKTRKLEAQGGRGSPFFSRDSFPLKQL
jgi:hypothetical protein